MKIIKIIIITLCTSNLYSQNLGKSINTAVEVNFPISPDVYHFHKNGIKDLNKYSGKLDFEILLYEIKSGGLSVPISIKYNSGGVKVDEIPSSVGLGWELSAGGSIIRNIKDFPDNEQSYNIDLNEGYDNGGTPFIYPLKIGMNRKKSGKPRPWPSVFDDTYFDFFNLSHITFMNDGENSWVFDSLPDTFILNAPNINTKFNCNFDNTNGFTTTFFHNDGSKMKNVNTGLLNFNGFGFSDQNFPIVGHYNKENLPLRDFTRFEILSGNGTLYKFEEPEISEQYFSPSPDSYWIYFDSNIDLATSSSYNNYNKRISSWNLTSIKNAEETKEIIFNYQTFNNPYTMIKKSVEKSIFVQQPPSDFWTTSFTTIHHTNFCIGNISHHHNSSHNNGYHYNYNIKN